MTLLTSPPTAVAPWRLFRAVVGAVDDLSPHLRRVRLVGPDLEHVADPGLDQRVKLLVGGGPLPDGTDWYAAWQGLPDDLRPAMRTYTTRRVVGTGTTRAVDIDMVLHDHPGPAGAWAGRAAVGQEITIVGPDARFPGDPGGRAFAPPADATDVLLVGDETALPAVARILEDLADGRPRDDRGGLRAPALRVTALVEVAEAADRLALRVPRGSEVVWLVRAGRPHGVALERAVRSWTLIAAGPPRPAPPAAGAPDGPGGGEGDDGLLWEVPEGGAPSASTLASAYVWVAGEQGVVRAVRRHLLTEVGLSRAQVALMGYWRLGCSHP